MSVAAQVLEGGRTKPLCRSKHELSAHRAGLLKLMQSITFGRIEGLDVAGGDPAPVPLGLQGAGPGTSASPDDPSQSAHVHQPRPGRRSHVGRGSGCNRPFQRLGDQRLFAYRRRRHRTGRTAIPVPSRLNPLTFQHLLQRRTSPRMPGLAFGLRHGDHHAD
jgi:hypothetical protein